MVEPRNDSGIGDRREGHPDPAGFPGMHEHASEITVYWRPGCGFCSSLLRGLDRRGVPHRRVNSWDDPTAAALVRAAANGNETVPTVTAGR